MQYEVFTASVQQENETFFLSFGHDFEWRIIWDAERKYSIEQTALKWTAGLVIASKQLNTEAQRLAHRLVAEVYNHEK